MKFEGREQFEAWLSENHTYSAAVWLELQKKGSPKAALTHADALEVALCYGWIDGQTKRGGEHSFFQRFGPRTKRSIWSKINCQSALRLAEAGQMQPAGLAEIGRAKADGRWEAAYEPQSRAAVPEDLRAALDANPEAKSFFAKLSSQNRYAILFRLQLAQKPATRARRLQGFVAMLAEGKTLH